VRGIPAEHHDAFVEVTHGHPLTLALLVDILGEQDLPAVLELTRYPDVVRALVRRFLDAVPGPEQWAALEVCVEARVTTESLLAGVLELDDTRHLFDWLRSLSFMEETQEGIFPHDIARDAFQADFRWRDPARYRQLHRKVRRYLASRFQTATGTEQQRVAYDKLFVHKRSPLMRPYFDWASLSSSYIEPARAEDHPAILEMLFHHEGAHSAEIAEHWLERQPEAFQVWRRGTGPAQGFMAHLVLADPAAQDLEADPAISSIWGHIQQAGPLRPAERFVVHRFWMGAEGYQDVAAQSVIAASASFLWLSLPRLAWSFPCTADADQWAPMFAYCNFTREPGADFTVAGRRFGVFAHDWRREPPLTWLDALAERDFDSAQGLDEQPAKPPLLVLSKAEFDKAVKHALRCYAQPDSLVGNPLTRSRLTVASELDPAASLVQLLRQAVEALHGGPREEKLYRALFLTYIEPAPTQEAAAERLRLPFNTYRYQLSRGIERVSDWLWAREIAASDFASAP
jgi:hypothetical protein